MVFVFWLNREKSNYKRLKFLALHMFYMCNLIILVGIDIYSLSIVHCSTMFRIQSYMFLLIFVLN